MEAANIETLLETSGSFSYRPPTPIVKPYEEIRDSSGGNFSGDFFSNISGSLKAATYISKTFKTSNNYIERLQEDIKDTFSLSMEGLAEACKVKSKKTLYNWRKEEKAIDRQKRGMDRLFELSRSARDWRDSGFIIPGNSLKEPLLRGKSLYDLLLADKIDHEAIQFCGTKMSTARMGEFAVRDPFA